MRKLELLAPAKNLECGMAAISHGADAVYIGAERFGARAAAGNSVDDIRELCTFAHQYGARVFVTVNTIVYEDELEDTQQLIVKLAEIGVDAILVQDMGVIEMHRVAIENVGHAPMLHASTQCDTRTAEKVAWLRSLGFTRAVLARELSLAEIKAIHEAVPDMELEVFVHGALCVSYSGICYASQHCFGRSANRGECAQFCRMKFDLIDADGKVIEHERHLLSLKDMSQIDSLEELADAGACSFKIEGRLKDVGYVKNVVSAFSQRLDQLIEKHPEKYCRASFGRVEHHFQPNLKKTFNRGFTSYFLNGRQPDIASFDTPKALGEYVGHVKEIRPDSFNVAGTASFSNGDGLCFINAERELVGFRVNRVVGNRLFPFHMPRGLQPNMALYRNNDEAFGKILSGQTADRRISVSMEFAPTADGFSLTMAFTPHATEQPLTATSTITFDHQAAKSPQGDNIRKQLLKLGNTVFACDNVDILAGAEQWFVPSSLLADLRRQTTESLAQTISDYHAQTASASIPTAALGEESNARMWQPAYGKFTYLYNVSNHLAQNFYASHGLPQLGPAMEVERARQEAIVMQCRHCLRYTLGYCVKYGGQKPTWHEPLSLRLGDGRRFRLEFNCAECQMNIYSEK
ncbi:MAG: U32 family peptidase [Prevotella sp.]|nr:U32 family peptidase [Prevotella sp.]